MTQPEPVATTPRLCRCLPWRLVFYSELACLLLCFTVEHCGNWLCGSQLGGQAILKASCSHLFSYCDLMPSSMESSWLHSIVPSAKVKGKSTRRVSPHQGASCIQETREGEDCRWMVRNHLTCYHMSLVWCLKGGFINTDWLSSLQIQSSKSETATDSSGEKSRVGGCPRSELHLQC